jgi:hypothetical protein
MNVKTLFIVFLCGTVTTTAFADDHAAVAASSVPDKRMSLRVNPVVYATDLAFLFVDNDPKTFAMATDVEFQYALNHKFSVSVVNTLFFENYLDSYFENSNGRYNEDYGFQFQCLFQPALLYRPYGRGMRGLSVSAFPLVGWTTVSTKHLDDAFTHLGLGAAIGYQWIVKTRWTLQAGAGASKTWTLPFSNNKGSYEDGWHFLGLPVDLHYTFRVGYLF